MDSRNTVEFNASDIVQLNSQILNLQRELDASKNQVQQLRNERECLATKYKVIDEKFDELVEKIIRGNH